MPDQDHNLKTDLIEQCPLAGILAQRLRQDSTELTRRWLGRINARVEVSADRIFPSPNLLNHVPLLIVGVADYLEDPERVVTGEVSVVAKAMELGELRFSQGFDAYELLKEYEIFGGILFAYMSRIVDEIDHPCTRSELLGCAHRLFTAISMIQQATVTNYLSLVSSRLTEREELLRGFNRTLSHELKNRIGAITGAAQVLELDTLAEIERTRLVSVISRNVLGMRVVLDNLVELSRLENDARQQRHVTLPAAAAEVARQLRDTARAKGVELRISPDIPAVEVNAAAVELCLSNLISNGIKYADRSKRERWVEVRAHGESANDDENPVVVEVHDNGLGVPPEKRSRLFERFYRAHDDMVTGAEGSGLGLSIVRDTAQSLGGSAWADFSGGGSVFAFSLPGRRAHDQDAIREAEHRAATS
ncbi:MAG TPA: HAMP domain-containing sensor histidine kinase [Gemmatimonadaceae bacterium]